MYRKFLLSSLAALTACGLSAKHLTPQEALSRAVSQPINGMQKAPANAAAMEIKRVLLNPDNAATVYLFASDGNALVVPADDRVAPVLGYIDGCADGELPPQMEWWLSEYSRQIDYVMAQPESGSGLYITLPSRKAETTKAPIAPMVSTRWNQDSPYNYSCPVVNGSKSMTGCVATAAAQVMKYHNYPPAGTGTITYTDNKTTRTLSLDGKPFDWDNMLDSYTGTYNTTQRDAVAFLMQAVGYASEMSYSPEASGAQSPTMLAGLKQYFGYNEKATMLNRQNFPLAEWEYLIYENLKTVGPVYYAGADNIQGGHAFVCDGYSSDGFFHFNWGWGGAYDGYFKLTALTPEGQGIGGNAGGFNFDQEIVLNMTAPGSPHHRPAGDLANHPHRQPHRLEVWQQRDKPQLRPGILNGRVLLQRFRRDSKCGVRHQSRQHCLRKRDHSRIRERNLPLDVRGYASFPLSIPDGLTSGNYRMYLVTRDYPNGEWTAVSHDISCVDFVNATISNGNISSVSNLSGSEIEGYDLSAISSIYFGYPIKVSYSREQRGGRDL